ncbi:hypothetical protein LNQ03_03360 [Klebsiella pneumoniae subsp. pneumoniae]|nr:hypothetical protein [Klebsiella pneumoniae subsp. pneumoniae]
MLKVKRVHSTITQHLDEVGHDAVGGDQPAVKNRRQHRLSRRLFFLSPGSFFLPAALIATE